MGDTGKCYGRRWELSALQLPPVAGSLAPNRLRDRGWSTPVLGSTALGSGGSHLGGNNCHPVIFALLGKV